MGGGKVEEHFEMLQKNYFLSAQIQQYPVYVIFINGHPGVIFADYVFSLLDKARDSSSTIHLMVVFIAWRSTFNHKLASTHSSYITVMSLANSPSCHFTKLNFSLTSFHPFLLVSIYCQQSRLFFFLVGWQTLVCTGVGVHPHFFLAMLREVLLIFTYGSWNKRQYSCFFFLRLMLLGFLQNSMPISFSLYYPYFKDMILSMEVNKLIMRRKSLKKNKKT